MPLPRFGGQTPSTLRSRSRKARPVPSRLSGVWSWTWTRWPAGYPNPRPSRWGTSWPWTSYGLDAARWDWGPHESWDIDRHPSPEDRTQRTGRDVVCQQSRRRFHPPECRRPSSGGGCLAGMGWDGGVAADLVWGPLWEQLWGNVRWDAHATRVACYPRARRAIAMGWRWRHFGGHRNPWLEEQGFHERAGRRYVRGLARSAWVVRRGGRNSHRNSRAGLLCRLRSGCRQGLGRRDRRLCHRQHECASLVGYPASPRTHGPPLA